MPMLKWMMPAVLLLALEVNAKAASIAISNAGFEDFVLADNQFTVIPGLVPSLPSFAVVSTDPIPSWVITGQLPGNGFGFASFASTWNPATFSFPTEAPEGHNVVLAERLSPGDLTISQVLPSVLSNMTYTLRAKVGDRLETNFDSYRVQLLAGGVVVAEDNNSVHPANGTWAETTPVVFTPSPGNPNLGQLLEVRIVVNGRAAIDDIRLDAVPEPTTLTLAGFGFAALAAWGWRRRTRVT